MRRAAPFLAPLVALIAHVTIFPGDFVFDDVQLIEKDPAIREASLQRIFADTYWGGVRIDLNYRPVTLATYGLNSLVSSEAWTFRATNWVLHALAAWLAFLVLERLFGDRWVAALCASLWAALAIHSETVANIVGRAELLASIAVLLVWWISLRDESGRSTRAAVLGGAILFLGIASKESAVVAIPIVLLTAWVSRRPIPWRLLTTSAGTTLVYLGIRWVVTAENRDKVAAGRASLTSLVDNPLIEVDTLTASLNGLALLAHYAWKTVLPISLSADYSFDQIPVRPLSDLLLWAMVAPQVALYAIALVWLFRRRHGLLSFSILLFPLAFAVTGNVLFRIGTIFGERLAFLPSLAIPLIIGAGLLALAESTRTRHLRTACSLLVLALIAAQGARCAVRGLDWRDRIVLYERTFESSPNSYRANLLGSQAALSHARDATSPREKEKLFGVAHARVNRALTILPDGGRAFGRRAEIRYAEAEHALAQGKREIAQAAFSEAFAIFGQAWDLLAKKTQSEPLFLIFRARAAFELGRYDEVSAELNRYTEFVTSTGGRLEPSVLHIGPLGRVRAGQGAFLRGDLDTATASADLAIGEVERGLQLNGERGRLENVRGVALALKAEVAGQRGAADERTELLTRALAAFNVAVQADSELVELRTNRGYCRFLLGDAAGAVADYEAGLRLCERDGPLFHPTQDSAWSFHRKLAAAHQSRGDAPRAERHRLAAATIEAQVRATSGS